jgi:hypothetical protein
VTKHKIILSVLLIALVVAIFPAVTKAWGNFEIYWTRSKQCMPGQYHTVYMAVRNDSTDEFGNPVAAPAHYHVKHLNIQTNDDYDEEINYDFDPGELHTFVIRSIGRFPWHVEIVQFDLDSSGAGQNLTLVSDYESCS